MGRNRVRKSLRASLSRNAENPHLCWKAVVQYTEFGLLQAHMVLLCEVGKRPPLPLSEEWIQPEERSLNDKDEASSQPPSFLLLDVLVHNET